MVVTGTVHFKPVPMIIGLTGASLYGDSSINNSRLKEKGASDGSTDIEPEPIIGKQNDTAPLKSTLLRTKIMKCLIRSKLFSYASLAKRNEYALLVIFSIFALSITITE